MCIMVIISRCVVPTRQYLTGNGFGCYAYIPIFWYEDAKIIPPAEYFNLVDHFYDRPARVQQLMSAGITLGVIFIISGVAFYLNDRYYAVRFQKRVYVD